MLNYARQRVREVLRALRTATLVSNGPAGMLAGEFPCEANELAVYLLVPQTSDQLVNLERGAVVILLSEGWELVGEAQIIEAAGLAPEMTLCRQPGAEWCVVVRVTPRRVHIHRNDGWGNIETVDLNPDAPLA